MSLRSIVLALSLSTPVFAAGRFDLVSVAHNEIDTHLVPGSDATGTPEALQGLWWMNGNPLADEVLSFASAQWSDIEVDGEVVGHQALIPVFDQGIWSWHDSIAGRVLYNLVLKSRLTYHVTFDLNFTHGQVTPLLKPISFIPGIELPASMLVDFKMNAVTEGEYSRDSILLGKKHSYRFRRIVDGNGNRLPAFDEFVDLVEVPNALLPICRIKGNTLPSACAK
ncbi:MAG: hypothetical protein H7318_10600 [Oligoflexus sp.]|nr:hypothetical protein [Oligoflexus sp.]